MVTAPRYRYQLEKKPLGKGGFARVHKAYDNRLQKDVALKRLRLQWLGHKQARQRFEREKHLLRTILQQHPNVPDFYDEGKWNVPGERNSFPFFTMEYVDGAPLSAHIHQNGAFSLRITLKIMEPIVDALDFAHQQRPHPIIHRDIKPSNILLSRRHKPYLIDFGIATTYQNATDIVQRIGTPGYMSPEVYNYSKATRRSDVYSLAVVIYEMLTGEAMHIASHRANENSQYNMWSSIKINRVAQVLWEATQPDPQDRQSSVVDLYEELIHAENSSRTASNANIPSSFIKGGSTRHRSGGSSVERIDTIEKVVVIDKNQIKARPIQSVNWVIMSSIIFILLIFCFASSLMVTQAISDDDLSNPRTVSTMRITVKPQNISRTQTHEAILRSLSETPRSTENPAARPSRIPDMATRTPTSTIDVDATLENLENTNR